jgi:glucose/mannose-6-phosphate isomerase
MAMRDAILSFNKQFEYEPEIVNGDKLKKFGKFVIAGMGGSNLVADLLRIRDPYVDIIVHRDYGLPTLSDEAYKKRLVIVDSYSGNTEEAISSFEMAMSKGYSIAVIATGGTLLERAQKYEVPYIQLPDTGIQPRSALGIQLRAVLSIMRRDDYLKETAQLTDKIKPEQFEGEGKNLAEKLKGYIPVIYASTRNLGLAYNWKIKFNETGKIPAFYNVFSELNHNEMTGFDVGDSSKHLSEKFHFIFLRDSNDHPRIQKRFDVLERLYRNRGLPVEVIKLAEEDVWLKIFSSLVLADWTAVYTAEQYGLESEQVPMVEEFKKLII